MEFQYNINVSMPEGWVDLDLSDSVRNVATAVYLPLILLTQGYTGSVYRNIGAEDVRFYDLVPISIPPSTSDIPAPSATTESTDAVEIIWRGIDGRGAGVSIAADGNSVIWFVENDDRKTSSTGFLPQILARIFESGWLSGTGSLPDVVQSAINASTDGEG